MTYQYLEEGTPEYEGAWSVLACVYGTLDGWQYMGPAFDGTHLFRRRAITGGQNELARVRTRTRPDGGHDHEVLLGGR